MLLLLRCSVVVVLSVRLATDRTLMAAVASSGAAVPMVEIPTVLAGGFTFTFATLSSFLASTLSLSYSFITTSTIKSRHVF